ncbi:MAG: hypothetical protein K6T61_03855 [Bryobacteraceae bacterium]|nr:hypothetical protein [Bryobacteraceae bacterium]
MPKIHAGRVLLGGLLAGVVINLSEWFWNGVVFAKEIQDAMASINRPQAMESSAMVVYVLWGFLVGILAVWVYAAVRPRFGAGPKTALRTGLMLWLLVYVQASVGMAPLDLFPARLMLIGLPVSLVEIVVATMLGAWLYKEEPAA